MVVAARRRVVFVAGRRWFTKFALGGLVVLRPSVRRRQVRTTAVDVDVWAMAGNIGLAFVLMTAMLFVALAAARWVFPKPFKWAARRPDTLFMWALCWCFILVYASYALGLSVETGAFLGRHESNAGISRPQGVGVHRHPQLR